jgi:hypothetical protein
MKTKTHFHLCGNHRWACKRENCNLSKHASCGNSVANDYPTCLKANPHVKLPTPRFSFVADENGYVVNYKGNPLAKFRLTKKQQKITRHWATKQKATRENVNAGKLLCETLDSGNGEKKLWAKIRKLDAATATTTV